MDTTFLLLLLLLLLAPVATTTTETIDSTTTFQELESMLKTLRSRGYTLFSNAITTTDLQYQLLTTAADDDANRTSSFTLFCPKDSQLFNLDMASDANVYVSTLLYHVIPHRRLTFDELQNLSASFLDTLLPHYSVLIGKTQNDSVALNNGTTGVMVDGVRVSDPDIFVGSKIVVHGIDDVLVTGLNKYSEDIDESDKNGLGVTNTPAAAPRNSPREFLAPMAQFDWNIAVPPPKGNLSPIPQFESANPVTSEEETLALLAQLAWNIPVEEPVLSPVKRQKHKSIKKRAKHRRMHPGNRRKNRPRDHRFDDL
ncbi:FAS1 domain-containing protein [Abeliophyllum distichum]|uniref:FAS1 domain-containing protein n=1 Tax=Abeliophyllum distichum TaxID=126358 RepID=A0ABD1SDC8_9LAMI